MKTHNSRRKFLKYMGLGSAGIAGIPTLVKANHQSESTIPINQPKAWFRNLAVESPDKSFTKKPIDVKVGIQPVSSTRVHKGSYEGPCRTGCDDCLSYEAEKGDSRRRAKEVQQLANKHLDKNIANIFPVARVEFAEGDRLEQQYFDILGQHASEVDLFVSNYRVPQIEEFKKPFAVPVAGVVNLDTTAYMRSLGLEGYAPYDWEEVNQLARLIQARKAVYHTKILNVSNNPHRKPQGVYSSMTYQTLKNKFGIDYEVVNYKEFFSKIDEIRKTPSKKQQSDAIAQQLLDNAVKSNMSKKDISLNIDFYLATKELMKRYDCNAFSIKCFELCNSQLPAEYNVVPCISNSLLKDEGYPGICEGDISAGIALMLSEYISRKSVYMGNPVYYKGENKIRIHHSVWGKKLDGIDKPDVPYNIISFTEDRWGATLRYDTLQKKGETVTLSRMHPSGEKMLLTKGKIIDNMDTNKIGCANRTFISMKNEMELRDIHANFGHHLAMVFGDYTKELKALCQMMNVEVVEFENEYS